MDIKNNYLVEKSNSLNSLSCIDMNLTELRFFCLYLSRLNSRNDNTRTVDISIKEFESFFGVQVNTTLLKNKIEKIMARTIKIENNNEVEILTVYSSFKWKKGEINTITIKCNDDLLPYLFQLKKNYTVYTIGNIAKLNSVHEIRLYEVAKQYERLQRINIALDKLQQMLGSTMREFKNFKRKVLDPAITDINKYTDIYLSYQKVLQMRKVVAIKFTITSQHREQNKTIQPPIQQPRIDMNIKSDTNDTECITNVPKLTYNLSDDDINTLSELCANQVKNANDCDLIIKDVIVLYNTNCCQKKINSPLAYARKILNSEIEKYLYNTSKTPKGYEPAPPGRVWNERADGTYELISIEKSKRGGNKFTTYDTSPEAMKRLDEINRERIEAAVKQFEEQKNAHPL